MVSFDDFTANGEPEAGAFLASGGAHGELGEILEEFAAFAVGDAGALVEDCEAPVLVVLPELDGDEGARGRVFHTVTEEVVDDLFDLGAVDFEGGGEAVGMEVDLGALLDLLHRGLARRADDQCLEARGRAGAFF